MDGSSRRGRRVLTMQRRYKPNRVADWFQAEAYRLALGTPQAQRPPRAIQFSDNPSIRPTGRVAAGGRS
jgi:hypothetical protein